MSKPVVTIHELETTKWTLDRLKEATPDEIESTRRYIVQKSSASHEELYITFFCKLLEDLWSVKEEIKAGGRGGKSNYNQDSRGSAG